VIPDWPRACVCVGTYPVPSGFILTRTVPAFSHGQVGFSYTSPASMGMCGAGNSQTDDSRRRARSGTAPFAPTLHPLRGTRQRHPHPRGQSKLAAFAANKTKPQRNYATTWIWMSDGMDVLNTWGCSPFSFFLLPLPLSPPGHHLQHHYLLLPIPP